MSERTARLYTRILTRFLEFVYIYIVYCLLTFFMSCVFIADVVHEADSGWLVC